MEPTAIAGFAGAGLAGAAYVPQIAHMVRERCVAGMSLAAFLVWCLASALLLTRAIATGEMVFITLGAMQTAATGFISGYISAHQGHYCPTHRPG
jgi:hypothetical protein